MTAGSPHRWSVGDVRITLLRESIVVMPLEVMFPAADRAALTEHADWLDGWLTDDRQLPQSVHTYVVESGGRTILVDTGNGTRAVPQYPDLSNKPSSLLADLAADGFPPGSVDLVVCTHLHIDHVGCNTTWSNGRWVPAFDRARYLFAEVEYRHWDAGAEGAAWTFDTAVRPLREAGVVELVGTDHVVDERVRLEPTPGHSPGHVSVRISAAGQEAVITGDVTHHPAQFAFPGWAMFLDGEPEQAVRTRRDFVHRYTDSDVRILGTHFPGTSSGFLTSSGDSVRFASG